MAEDAINAHLEPTSLHQEPATGTGGIPSLHAGVTPQTGASTTSGGAGAKSSSRSTPTATGVRQRVHALGDQLDAATDHPAVKNVKVTAQKQVSKLREVLGRSPPLVNLERSTGVDRVILVVGGILAYILVIPFNFLGLALPVTTLLALVPPSFIAFGILEEKTSAANEAATRALLSYFVALGFIQFLESLAAGILYSKIPQYYTLKLVFLAYLLHPKTQGALKLHNMVFKPLFISNTGSSLKTPPTAHASASSASSPTAAASPSLGSGNVQHTAE
ncbi:TB2/DP1, HVA22 family-domain-containing protein [Kockovaella imperatae]|uniref:Protein YOP1 n=1 Tax=Kockovaella imperatae TaxID=4999 RepID=A0A1Y1U8N2_9TREE|nr:TB2/DP1, HVA22 family-domain-containing protein [Kockovaella imperatae]ORX34372.1 TB2/DP1, HVA22 family-domain-containing protein [Kockovaella imperatae]